MLLRASSQQTGHNYNLNAVTDPEQPSGVAHGEWLTELTDLTVRGDWLGLCDLRGEAEAHMGPQLVADALVVASAFNGITRVADATGIPLDENTADTTGDMRADTGIDSFDYAEKQVRYEVAADTTA